MSDKRKRLIIRSVILTLVAVALGYTLFQILFNTTKSVEVNDAAPNFELTDLNGHKVQLKDYRGKAVMLNFWASWCDPCKREMPYINEAYKDIQNKGVVILGVNIGESHFAVQNFVDNHQINFTILTDKNKDVTNAYGVGPIPTTFFIDKNGKVVDKVVGSMPDKAYILKKLHKIQP